MLNASFSFHLLLTYMDAERIFSFFLLLTYMDAERIFSLSFLLLTYMDAERIFFLSFRRNPWTAAEATLQSSLVLLEIMLCSIITITITITIIKSGTSGDHAMFRPDQT